MRRSTGVALLVYTAFAMVATWPLVRDLGSVVPGWPGDQPFYVWAMDRAEAEKLLGGRIAERRTIDGYELFILGH